MNEAEDNLYYQDQSKSSQQVDSRSLTVGLQLKQARKGKGLSIEDIASELKLIKTNVLDIESSEYKRRIPITFYRGYIRSYAKFLGLSDVELIEAFNVEALVVQRQAQEQALPKNNPVKKFLFTEKQLKRFIYVVIGVVIVTYLMLPHSQKQPKQLKHSTAQNTKTTRLALDKTLEQRENAVLD